MISSVLQNIKCTKKYTNILLGNVSVSFLKVDSSIVLVIIILLEITSTYRDLRGQETTNKPPGQSDLFGRASEDEDLRLET